MANYAEHKYYTNPNDEMGARIAEAAHSFFKVPREYRREINAGLRDLMDANNAFHKIAPTQTVKSAMKEGRYLAAAKRAAARKMQKKKNRSLMRGGGTSGEGKTRKRSKTLYDAAEEVD